MSRPILVTGALGNVGAAVVAELLAAGQPVRAADKQIERVVARFGSTVAAARLEFGQPATYAAALEGAERMLLVRPPAVADTQRAIVPALDAARRAGVRHVVFLSLIGAERNRLVPHYAIEQYLKTSGMSYTFLRPSFFMQNLSTTHRAEIRDRNEIYVPAGTGKTSFIDARDIAAVAAKALAEDGHAGMIYELTGAEALDYYDVAGRLSAALGRPISYRRPGLLGFIRRQRAAGTPLAFIAVMAGIYSTARLGMAGRVTGDLRRLLGRAPICMRQYAEDYRACWQPELAAA